MTDFQYSPQQREWLDALRSGDYKQGTARLHNDSDEFCCLGVACDLFKDRLNLNITKMYGEIRYGGCDRCVPPSVVDYLGLYGTVGNAANSGSCLSAINDAGLSFIEIADLIQLNPSVYLREFHV